MRVDKTAHQLLDLVAGLIDTQNREFKIRLRRLWADNSKFWISSGLMVKSTHCSETILGVRVERFVVDAFTLEFLTPTAGLVTAAFNLSDLA